MVRNTIDILTLTLVRILIGALQHLPNGLALALARLYVRILLGMLLPRANRVTLRNLQLVFPNRSESERKAIARKSREVLAITLVSFAKNVALSREQARQVIPFKQLEQDLQAIRQKHPGKAVLYAAAHYGPFETIVQLCVLASGPVAILARGFGLPRLDAWWNRRREMFGCEVFGRTGGYRETIRRLHAGQDVTMLCDQNVKRNHAVFVDFFGIPAATTKTLALASLRTGAPVYLLVGYALELNSYGYILHELPEIETLPGNSEQKVAAFTRVLHQHLEQAIEAHPEQWFWLHRRFKTRPEGERERMYEGC